MKKFALKLIVFLLPVILVSYAADVFLSRQLKKSKTYAEGEYTTWNDIFNGTVNSAVVINGASRAWRHINPTRLGDSLHTTAYNLGIDGHTFWMQYLRHKLFLKYNAKPALIIHSLDVFTLRKGTELFNADQFLPYLLFDKDIRNSIESFEGFKQFDYNIPLVRYYGKKEALAEVVTTLVKPGKVPLRTKGYSPKDEPWAEHSGNHANKTASYTVHFDSASIELFDRYLQECKAADIDMVFVYSPEYIDGQKFIANREDIMELFRLFSRKYNIPLFDFSDHPISSERKYFYNSEHLNKEGAELFTNELINKLRNEKSIRLR